MEEVIMSLLHPLDPNFPIERQLADADAVVMANVFTLDKAGEQTFLRAWQDDAAFMRSRCPASASHSRQSINIELPSANDSFRHYFAVGSRVSQRLNSTPKLAI
jgi:hypothetical protein